MANDWQDHPMTKFQGKLIGIAVLMILIGALMFVSVVNIGGNEVGIIEKKFGGGKLPPGNILATQGENGIQAQTLEPGWHFFYWPWQYDIEKVKVTIIKNGFVGLVTASDGQSLPRNTIYAPEWDDPKKMLIAEYFLSEGKGFKGPQLSVLKPGTHRINTSLFTVTLVPITNVKAGYVAVIKSNVGPLPESPSADGLVADNERGIRLTALLPPGILPQHQSL